MLKNKVCFKTTLTLSAIGLCFSFYYFDLDPIEDVLNVQSTLGISKLGDYFLQVHSHSG